MRDDSRELIDEITYVRGRLARLERERPNCPECFDSGHTPGGPCVCRRFPPIERYVRVSYTIPTGSIEAGLLYDRGEDIEHLRRDMFGIVQRSSDTCGPDVKKLTGTLENAFDAAWRGRAWFVEVWDKESAITQVYQPFGMPRVR